MHLHLKRATPILVLAPSTPESYTRGIHEGVTIEVVIFFLLFVQVPVLNPGSLSRPNYVSTRT